VEFVLDAFGSEYFKEGSLGGVLQHSIGGRTDQSQQPRIKAAQQQRLID
jgi:hypothetical protein